jgi:hypothetical protein
MIYIRMTAREAVLDFAEVVFPKLWKGKRNGKNKEYAVCWQLIKAVDTPKFNAEWAARVLTKYGGLRYRIETTFELVKAESDPGDWE